MHVSTPGIGHGIAYLQQATFRYYLNIASVIVNYPYLRMQIKHRSSFCKAIRYTKPQSERLNLIHEDMAVTPSVKPGTVSYTEHRWNKMYRGIKHCRNM